MGNSTDLEVRRTIKATSCYASGYHRVAPAVDLVALRVFNDTGKGELTPGPSPRIQPSTGRGELGFIVKLVAIACPLTLDSNRASRTAPTHLAKC